MIFQNEIRTILTPSASKGVSFGVRVVTFFILKISAELFSENLILNHFRLKCFSTFFKKMYQFFTGKFYNFYRKV